METMGYWMILWPSYFTGHQNMVMSSIKKDYVIFGQPLKGIPELTFP